MGVAVGGFGLAATGYERLVPYVRQPDDIVPGESTWYATCCRECPAGCGLVVRNRESRVVKCEGNPAHPINSGALCARGQAALQGLYDPDRFKSPLKRTAHGEFDTTDWNSALDAAARAVSQGGRIAMICDLQTGSMAALIREWLSALGSDTLVMYEPIDYEPIRSLHGGVVPSFGMAESDCLISFGADFLETWLSPVEYARQFAGMRRVRHGTRGYFVYVGPRVSATAAAADVRVIVKPGDEEVAAAAIAGWAAEAPGVDRELLRQVSDRVRRAKKPLALPGLTDGAARAAHTLNRMWNTTLVRPQRPHAITGVSTRSRLEDLISEMRAGRVDTLIVWGANPVYSMPASAGFKEAMGRVKTVISLSSWPDETAGFAHWILPSHTALESWGDYKPYPDVLNLMQPVMGSLFDTRHPGDILIEIARRAGIEPNRVFGAKTFYEYLRKRWGCPVPSDGGPDASAEKWEALVRVGGTWPGSPPTDVTPPTGYSSLPVLSQAARMVTPGPQPPDDESLATASSAARSGADSAPGAVRNTTSAEGIRLYAYPHIYLYDGRGANKRWLQEIPEPVVKTAWCSWAEVHPETAKRLGVATEDVVRITSGSTSVDLPVYVWEGVARDTVAAAVGQGHDSYGRSARGCGANVGLLLGASAGTVNVTATGSTRRIVRVRGDSGQHGRGIAQFAALHGHTEHESHRELTLPLPEGYGWKDFLPGHRHKDYRWAMAVDLSLCVGCGACTAACYAENNVGVVGAEGVMRGREMSWIRIDRYIDWGRPAAPIIFQPMMCQQCDSAPCETVCPVYAAVHSEDGINEQVYNRCVGTRYCSNNCPYKVRRFNWFDYEWPEPLDHQLNPDVTVRCRGVMEKCTFCVQRIRQARKTARREGRRIRDGEVTPACVETCPTGALTFGDLMDPGSRVSKIIREDPRAYQALHELNTKPGVVYLRRVVEDYAGSASSTGRGSAHEDGERGAQER